MVKYCVANDCPIDEKACAWAAQNGHLECLKYLHEEAKAPWDSATANVSAANGHLHILEYLVERKYDRYNERACLWAAENGHLDCLKYLHETAKVPWDEWSVLYAHEKNQPECVQYLLDNNCPLPRGWRYEDGELYSESESESKTLLNAFVFAASFSFTSQLHTISGVITEESSEHIHISIAPFSLATKNIL